ncbi:uncharacterized protein LOC114873736 [Osmia bicornis bicornis]|uniref:uncharacterized protein LOC114873736 n=1 Tax=Osmia bicornis bicornis TaxID=1437191 RepID=UPI001EAEEA9D|nr:uncharacterized protein LOC114873736 [Osmia bicornis bicornis]
MKAICGFILILLFRQAISGIIRNPPAFSKPVYSDSYLPAAMQVIFHAVEQLKLLQSEETSEVSIVTSSSKPPINDPIQNEQSTTEKFQTTPTSTSTIPQEGINSDEEESNVNETSKGMENSTKTIEVKEEYIKATSSQPIEDSSHQELPEINQETPEANYATPETNYEASEQVHNVQESNQEVPEENHESTVSSEVTKTSLIKEATANSSGSSLEEDGNKEDKKKPTIESVVQGVYEILKPTTSKFLDEDGDVSGESKMLGVSVEKLEGIEDEEDENRFTRLGEKVTQVPRPSLSSYLRRSNVRPSATLQQLANLYDSLSKDARKQGFGKYTGYSDEVLNTLETSAEGGIGSQLKKILDKVLERNELTRDDAKTRTHQAVRDLNNPSSTLNKELRPILPLRYSP